MKKITLLLLLSTIYLVSFGQGIVVRTAPVSATPSASNYNKQVISDANLKIALTLGIPYGASYTLNNANPEAGKLFYNTTTNKLGVFNGSTWDEVGGGGGTSYNFSNLFTVSGANVTIDTTKIRTVLNSWTKAQADVRYLVTANNGLTKTGNNITLGGDYTNPITVGNATSSSKPSFSLSGNSFDMGFGFPEATLLYNGLSIYNPLTNYGSITLGRYNASDYTGTLQQIVFDQYVGGDEIYKGSIYLRDNLRKKGLFYYENYSNNWTNADSLVLANKGYVDGLVAGSVPIGTNKQVLGYSSGTSTPVTLGLSQLSDVASIPSFSSGVYAFTGINPTTGSALRSFIEFSTTTPKAGTFPTYGTGGVLPVANGVDPNDAVNVSQINAALGVTVNSAANPLSLTDRGYYNYTGTVNATWNLPASPPVGRFYRIYNMGTGGAVLTVNGNGNNVYQGGTTSSTITLNVGENLTLQFTGLVWASYGN